MDNRTDRFMARVDAHLATLVDDTARKAFLGDQIAAWEIRYARFIVTEGDSAPVTDPKNPPTAFDFINTITALVGRRDLIEKGAAILQAAE